MITCSVCRRRHVVGSTQYIEHRRIAWIRAHNIGAHKHDAAGYQEECPLCQKGNTSDICGCLG